MGHGDGAECLEQAMAHPRMVLPSTTPTYVVFVRGVGVVLSACVTFVLYARVSVQPSIGVVASRARAPADADLIL